MMMTVQMADWRDHHPQSHKFQLFSCCSPTWCGIGGSIPSQHTVQGCWGIPRKPRWSQLDCLWQCASRERHIRDTSSSTCAFDPHLHTGNDLGQWGTRHCRVRIRQLCSSAVPWQSSWWCSRAERRGNLDCCRRSDGVCGRLTPTAGAVWIGFSSTIYMTCGLPTPTLTAGQRGQRLPYVGRKYSELVCAWAGF